MILFIKAAGIAISKKINKKNNNHYIVLILISIMALLGITSTVQAVDLMAGGKVTVTDTFGASSAIAKWIILAEVIVGIITFIKTKNVFMLFGIAVVIVFTTIGFSLTV